MSEELKAFADALFVSQEPLGPPFARILADGAWDMYVKDETVPTTTVTTLRALAARCCTGETGWKLQCAILEAMGWEYVEADHVWAKFIPPDDYENRTFMQLPNPLTDLNASAAAMPAGWMVLRIEQDLTSWRVVLALPGTGKRVGTRATTEPLARTAAAMMARAAEEEQKEGEV